MRKHLLFKTFLFAALCGIFSFTDNSATDSYQQLFKSRLKQLKFSHELLLSELKQTNGPVIKNRAVVLKLLSQTRVELKKCDLWLRYLDPVNYKLINGPLPVEWETEVFEKFEKPYRRVGAGLTLAELYLEGEDPLKDSLHALIQISANAIKSYESDSISAVIGLPSHFYFCNRLFLLNLATIYTTGFECPDSEKILPELDQMLAAQAGLYAAFNASFPSSEISIEYREIFDRAAAFVHRQNGYSNFDHYTFVRDYINPLFKINQQHIKLFGFRSRSFNDFTLNDNAKSIFSKSLFRAQDIKGVFHRVSDTLTLREIRDVGRDLFYDPLLSGNNKRSCASCHKPTEFFTSNNERTAKHFNEINSLPRNTPSLMNSQFNHLLMADGRHLSLLDQARAVITNTAEMACGENDLVKKLLGCKTYRKKLQALTKLTPHIPKLTIDHVASVLMYYYSGFSSGLSDVDRAMNTQSQLSSSATKGFNLFMGKAQCATCHFAPLYNGIKPPYVSSEFEVLGVPADTGYSRISEDAGRYTINQAPETKNAFRTTTVRNIKHTSPYMHNGVFTRLEQVIDFYDTGGGGTRFNVVNQTLSTDSLHLTPSEKRNLMDFLGALTEDVAAEPRPASLPHSRNKSLNSRKVGGEY